MARKETDIQIGGRFWSTTVDGKIVDASQVEGLDGALNLNLNNGEGNYSIIQKTNSEKVINAASGENSIALGKGNNVTGGKSAAIGDTNAVTGGNSVALAYQNKVYADASVALGHSNTIGTKGQTGNASQGSVAAGHGNTLTGDASFAANYGNIVSGTYAAAFGGSNIASGYASFVAGQENEVTVQRGVSFGYNNKVSGTNAAAFGSGNIVNGYSGFVAGEQNKVACQKSAAFGGLNQITDSGYSFAAGYDNKIISGDGANSAFGRKSTIKGWGNATFGNTTQATYNNFKLVCGTFNSEYNNSLFEVGNGTESSRSTALVVLQDGRAKVKTAPKENNDVVRLEELNSISDKLIYATDAEIDALWA